MTEDTNDQAVIEDELTTLKARADQIGLKYHPNIGVETLRERLNEALTTPAKPAESAPVNSEGMTENERRLALKREALKLVRVRVTCMNPNKREWEGEIFTTGNATIGTIRRMVPFEREFHVEQMIYNMLKDRKCQTFYTVNGPRGNKIRKGKLINEFAIEVLPQLTEQELKELAQRQAMAAGQADAA